MFWRTALLLGCAAILLAQEPEYTGPSILTRGQPVSNAPVGETGLRPYVGIYGIFDNSLTALSVNQAGQLPNAGAGGVEAQVGLYGHHNWKRTLLDLDYRGTYRHYTRRTYYDGSDQILNLGLTHIISKRLQVSIREAGGTFSRNFLLYGLGYYTPDVQGLPANELFDNRVNYASTAAGLTFQKTARLSFHFEGDGYVIQRQSSALYGLTGAVARGDFAYRFSRYTTIGADYEYNHFDFTKAVGSTGVHTTGINLASRFTRLWEFGVYGGVARMESVFLSRVQIDPVVAAIIGQTVGVQIAYRARYIPTVRARLSRRFRAGLFLVDYKHEVTGGNGFFLTSLGDSGTASYTYTGINYWSFNTGVGYYRLAPLVQDFSPYRSFSYRGGVSRLIRKNLYMVAQVYVRKYDSGVVNFIRTPLRATFGVTWSPGERPITIW